MIHLFSQNLRNSVVSGFYLKINFAMVVAEGRNGIHLRFNIFCIALGQSTEEGAEKVKRVFFFFLHVRYLI